MRRTGRFFVALSLIACTSGTSPDSSYIGSYSLISINGASFPISKPDRIEYVQGAVWLDADGKYQSYVLSQDCFVNGCTTFEFKLDSRGTWTRNNSQFTLVDSTTGERTVWSYSDRKLTVTDTKHFAVSTILVFAKDEVTQPRT